MLITWYCRYLYTRISRVKRLWHGPYEHGIKCIILANTVIIVMDLNMCTFDEIRVKHAPPNLPKTSEAVRCLSSSKAFVTPLNVYEMKKYSSHSQKYRRVIIIVNTLFVVSEHKNRDENVIIITVLNRTRLSDAARGILFVSLRRITGGDFSLYV